jgi:hypothetical protein
MDEVEEAVDSECEEEDNEVEVESVYDGACFSIDLHAHCEK